MCEGKCLLIPPQRHHKERNGTVQRSEKGGLCDSFFFFLLLKEARRDLRVLLLGHTNSAPMTPSGLGVLATNTEAPAVTKPTVVFHLLQHFKVITEL